MGSPAVPNDAQLVEVFALARAIVLAVENDEPWPEPLVHPLELSRSSKSAVFQLAQLVVLLAGGLAPVADAIETMSRATNQRRLNASVDVARAWFRASEDNSAEAMRVVAREARKEPV